MKQVAKFQTRDGKLHNTHSDAKRHADSVYGLQLSKIAHAIAKLEKYVTIADWINDNLGEFKELLELEKDTGLDQEDE